MHSAFSYTLLAKGVAGFSRVCADIPFKAQELLPLAVAFPEPLRALSDVALVDDGKCCALVSARCAAEEAFNNGVATAWLIYVVIVAAIWFDGKK